MATTIATTATTTITTRASRTRVLSLAYKNLILKQRLKLPNRFSSMMQARNSELAETLEEIKVEVGIRTGAETTYFRVSKLSAGGWLFSRVSTNSCCGTHWRFNAGVEVNLLMCFE